jgi:hypothetical protein
VPGSTAQLLVGAADVGTAHMAAGNLAAAESSFVEAIDVGRRTLGDDSEPVARTLANRATVYRVLQLLVELYQDWKRPSQAAACAARIVSAK